MTPAPRTREDATYGGFSLRASVANYVREIRPSMIAAILLLLALAPQAQSTSAAAQTSASAAPTLSIEVRRVELMVSVTGKKSHQPATGLHASDFRILDDGHPAAITHFDPPGRTRPLMIWLLFRNDFIDQKTLPKIEAEMPAALDVLPASALVGVASYSESGSALWLTPQASRSAVVGAIHRLVLANPDASPASKGRRVKARPGEPVDPADTDGPVKQQVVPHPIRQLFKTWDMGPSGGLRLVAKDWTSRSASGGYLPVVVIVSDEMSMDYVWSANRLKNEMLRDGLTLDELTEPHSGFSRYWVTVSKIYAPGGVPLDPGGQIYRYRYETYLAQASGGEVIGVKEHDYRAGFERLFRDLHNIYLLEFAPQTIDDRMHSISVELEPRVGLRPGSYKIRARTRYFAGSGSSDSSASAVSTEP